MLPDCSHPLFQQSFPAEIAALPRIKSDVLGAAQQAGWSGDNLGRLELVLEEGTLNIIRYAYPERTGEIKVTLAAIEDEMLLRLEDTGIPFDLESVPLTNLDTPAEERPIGGLGIHLMRNIAEKIEYRRAGERNVLDILLNRNVRMDD